MTNFVKNQSTSGENFIHVYSDISKEELDKKVDDLLKSSGYRLSEGKPGGATYVKGNRTMRILFGAFVKYFKFRVVTNPGDAGEIKLAVTKFTTGMSGGIIGVSQVKTELKRLGRIFQTI